MKSSKISPAPQSLTNDEPESRMDDQSKIKEWILSASQFPLFYVTFLIMGWTKPLPWYFSSRKRQSSDIGCINTVPMHFEAVIEGFYSCISLCCCFGCFGKYGPDHFYGS